MEHFLLPTQQDAVYRVIQGAELDPIDFEWSRLTGEKFVGTIPCLTHTPSQFRFAFDFDELNNHHAVYTLGEQRPTGRVNAGDWPTELRFVGEWLDNLKRETLSPNLWAGVDRQRKFVAATEPGGSDNSPFNPQEQAQIAAQLNEIKELLVRTEQLEGERLRAIEARLDYLRDASTRMGRRDWLNIFYGTIFAWALTALIPPDGVREVLIVTAHGIEHLFGGELPQLPAPQVFE
jgi:hypothetical protein